MPAYSAYGSFVTEYPVTQPVIADCPHCVLEEAPALQGYGA